MYLVQNVISLFGSYSNTYCTIYGIETKESTQKGAAIIAL